MKIAVILPSRGLVFAETLQELLGELKGYDYSIYWSHEKPLPRCFNMPLGRALKKDFTHFWFVEEDMILPKGVLKAMLDMDKPAVTCDYPISQGGNGTVLYDPEGKALFSGTGCLLVKREVLEQMPRPIFRTDILWRYKATTHGAVFEAMRQPKDVPHYGLHDITFGVWLYTHGMPIEVCPVECGQRKLKAKGANATNKGADEIVRLDKLEKMNTVVDMYESGKPDTKLVDIYLKSKITMVPRATAERFTAENRGWPIEVATKYLTLRFDEWPHLAKRFL